ncbi:hypothetical protein MRX96_021014 [Rhipicephalus microplus]
MINIYAEFQAQAIWRDGVVNELRHQLDDARRQAAELRLQVALGGAPAPGRSFVDVVTSRRDDVVVFSASPGSPGLRGTPQSLEFPGISRERQELPVPPQHVAFITPREELRYVPDSTSSCTAGSAEAVAFSTATLVKASH